MVDWVLDTTIPTHHSVDVGAVIQQEIDAGHAVPPAGRVKRLPQFVRLGCHVGAAVVEERLVRVGFKQQNVLCLKKKSTSSTQG